GPEQTPPGVWQDLRRVRWAPFGAPRGFGGRAAPPRAGGVWGGSSPRDNRGEAVTPEPQPQRIDRYVGQYAERAVGMVASEIRALFAVAARPEIVSLAGGSPYVAALPLEVVGDMIGQLIAGQ